MLRSAEELMASALSAIEANATAEPSKDRMSSRSWVRLCLRNRKQPRRSVPCWPR
jgi:hypothetical protein